MAPLVVTAYYEFPSKYQKRTYLEWAQRFLRTMNCNIVVFVETEEMRDTLGAFCSWPRRVEFVILKISEWKAMQAPLGLEFWQRQIHLEAQKTPHTVQSNNIRCPQLGAIWYEKMWFVEKASKLTSFSYDSLIWCDIGILRSREQQRLAYLFGLSSAPFQDSRLHILKVNPEFDESRYTTEFYNPQDTTTCTWSGVSFGCGILGGTTEAWEKARRVYDDMLQTLFGNNSICVFSDQVVWTNCIARNKHVFTIEQISKQGDQWMSLLYKWSLPPASSRPLCFVLNLDEREDKWWKFCRQLDERLETQLMILRFPAILHAQPVEYGDLRNGCTKSHLDILRLGKTVFVFEDDAVLLPDFYTQDFAAIASLDHACHLINFGPSTICGWAGQQTAAIRAGPNPEFVETRITSASQSMMWSTRMGQFLSAILARAEAKHLKHQDSCIDFLVGSDTILENVIQLVPRQVLVRQQPGRSDLTKVVEDYTLYFDVVNSMLAKQPVEADWVKLKTLNVEIAGGFGNQLFQLAAGIMVGNHTRRHVSFVKSQHNKHSAIDYWKTVFSQFSLAKNKQQWNEPCIVETREVNTKQALLQAAAQETQQNLALRGYFQFAEAAEVLTPSMLHLPYMPTSKFAFLHIRGGDFLGNSLHSNHELMVRYYKRALDEFSAATRILVFTNDRDHAQKMLADIQLPTSRYLFAPDESEVDAFARMMACSHGGICANSTFSWWAAVWGSGEVYTVPSTWFFTDDHNVNVDALLSHPKLKRL